MTAVVVDTPKDQKRRQAPGEMAIFEPEEEQAKGKDYRRPTPEEVQKAEAAAQELTRVFREIPFGLPTEPLAGKEALAPKWDHDKKDGELIDDASRFGGNREKSKAAYEEGMYRAFLSCHQALAPEGRLVVDFVVGRVLSGNGAGEAVSGLDEVTNYYLLHRHSFGMGEVTLGPCILYAISCGLSDGALVDQFDLLTRTGGREGQEDNGDDESEGDDEAILSAEAGGSGSQVKLKPWNLRRRPGLGYPSGAEATYRRRHAAKQMTLLETTGPDPKVRQIPLIDQVHRLLHLWRGGDQVAVNDYLEERGLLRNPLFQQLLQALIELAPRNSEERSLLESLSNHVSVRRVPQAQQDSFNYEENRMMATEIIFVVEESPEGGFEAKALGHAIFTQGETVEEVRKAAKDAVACHFEEPDRPRMIRLHWVRDELIAV